VDAVAKHVAVHRTGEVGRTPDALSRDADMLRPPSDPWRVNRLLVRKGSLVRVWIRTHAGRSLGVPKVFWNRELLERLAR
jgi:hypothetical protein